MVADILQAADPVLNIKGKIRDPRQFISLDDTILKRVEFYGSDFANGQAANDLDDSYIATAQGILRRLRNRELYKFCGECLISSAHIQNGYVSFPSHHYSLLATAAGWDFDAPVHSSH